MTTTCSIPVEQGTDPVPESTLCPTGNRTENHPARSCLRGIAASKLSSGAKTCIVIGSLAQVENLDLSPFTGVLWFVRGKDEPPGHFGIDRRKFLVEELEQSETVRLDSLLETFINTDPGHLPAVFLTDEVIGECAPLFLQTVNSVYAACERIQRSRKFRVARSFPYQKNHIANLRAYAHQRVPSSWAGALDGLPAFICGAGPSLDASIAKLAECAHHGVVFGADTALHALHKHGIEVDIALNLDPLKTPANCLTPGARPPAYLILAVPSEPIWTQVTAPERTYFITGDDRFLDALEKAGVPKTGATVSENCGRSSFELAVYLGCRPIYLFGMDNAVDSKNPARWHCQNLTEGLEKRQRPLKNIYPKVPGNYQEEIPTSMFRDWRNFDHRCSKLPAGLVYNVIDRGARLRNTTLVHPDDFAIDPRWPDKSTRLSQLPTAESIDNAKWKNLRNSTVKLAKSAEEISRQALGEIKRGNQLRAVQLLAELFKSDKYHIVFGNYALKFLPHFTDWREPNLSLWESLASECRELSAFARALR